MCGMLSTCIQSCSPVSLACVGVDKLIQSRSVPTNISRMHYRIQTMPERVQCIRKHLKQVQIKLYLFTKLMELHVLLCTPYSMNRLFSEFFRKFGGVFLEVCETISGGSGEVFREQIKETNKARNK